MPDEFVNLNVFGTIFEVTSRYGSLQPIGMGAFGLVCSGKDMQTGQDVAIKKILKPFSNAVLAKRTYRELKLLKYLKHDNVCSFTRVLSHVVDNLPERRIHLAIAGHLLGTDLQRLLASRQLEKQYIQYFLYQMLRALKYVHSAAVIHRDLKPSNILVNENCDLKICDLGLARLADPQMTGYVSTRYYRAPEIMLSWQKYDVAVDIWSVACIFSEMLEGKPLFPGKDHVHQFQIITELLGTPDEEVMKTICSENTLKFVRSLPSLTRQPFSAKFKTQDPLALDLLEKMLVFDPKKRITATEALAHPYLEPYHDLVEEPVATVPFDWSFTSSELPLETLKVKMYQEVADFRQAADAAIVGGVSEFLA